MAVCSVIDIIGYVVYSIYGSVEGEWQTGDSYSVYKPKPSIEKLLKKLAASLEVKGMQCVQHLDHLHDCTCTLDRSAIEF